MHVLGSYDRAETHLREAIRSGTKNYTTAYHFVDPYYHLALLLADKVVPPRYPEARIPLERAVMLFPKHRPTRLLLARCLPEDRASDAQEHLAVAEHLRTENLAAKAATKP